MKQPGANAIRAGQERLLGLKEVGRVDLNFKFKETGGHMRGERREVKNRQEYVELKTGERRKLF